jgi:hypothetical protein
MLKNLLILKFLFGRDRPRGLLALEEQILTHVLSASYGSPVPRLFDPPIAGPLLRN